MEKSRNSSNSMNQGLSEIPEQVDVRFAIKLETYIYGQISKENWTHMLKIYRYFIKEFTVKNKEYPLFFKD